jgi:hypothetical protein
MTEPDDGERRIADLNMLGRLVYFAGQTVRVTSDLLDSVIHLAVNTYEEAERAFRQGLDPNVTDAEIIEEHSETDAPARRDAAENSE